MQRIFMDSSPLDDRIDKALKSYKRAKKMLDQGEITQDQYMYHKNRYYKLIEQKNKLAEKEPQSTSPLGFILFILFVGIVIFLGNFHIVFGSNINGFLLTKRSHFGYEEVIINTDKILSLPYQEAKLLYPLGSQICINKKLY